MRNLNTLINDPAQREEHTYLIIKIKTQKIFNIVDVVIACTAAQATRTMIAKGYSITEHVVRLATDVEVQS